MRNLRQGRRLCSASGGHSSASSLVARTRDWRTLDEFLLEHVAEALIKIIEGRHEKDCGGDGDRIWGKLVLMEGRGRLAKLYLRNSVIVVDGGEQEFDGRTVGFNHFRQETASGIDDLRRKITDGVILKMSRASGNVKAMALGTTPIYVLGMEMREDSGHTPSMATTLPGGRLPPKTPHEMDSARVVKLFDAHHFKRRVEEYDSITTTEEHLTDLFRQVCVRIAMVKKTRGGWDDRLPAWFLLINIDALCMLARRVPSACNECESNENFIHVSERVRRRRSSVLKAVSDDAHNVSMPKVPTFIPTPGHSTERNTDERTELMLAKMLGDALDLVSRLQTTILEKALSDNAAVMGGGKQQSSSTPATSVDVRLNEGEGARRTDMSFEVLKEARERRRPRRYPLTHTLFRNPPSRENDASVGGSASTSDYDESSNRGVDEDISVTGGQVENSASSASWEEGENESAASTSRDHLTGTSLFKGIDKLTTSFTPFTQGYYYCEEDLSDLTQNVQTKRSLPRIQFSGQGERY